MKFASSRFSTVVAAAAVLGVVGVGSAVAAGQIGSGGILNNSVTSYDLKDGTIQKRDLTAKNFRKFTETATVLTATTAGNPTFAGANVVALPASGGGGAGDSRTPLVTLELDKGTWLVEATAQFWHLNGNPDPAPDYGVVALSLPGAGGVANAFTADVPDGGTNAAQTTTTSVIKVTADNTALTVLGSLRGNAGQAGASVVATKVAFGG